MATTVDADAKRLVIVGESARRAGLHWALPRVQLSLLVDGYQRRDVAMETAYLDSPSACTIATSIIHFILDYCNSLYSRLPKSQLSRLQQIQNSVARAVAKAPKSCYITAILHCLHWLRITERIEYKLLSLIYKVHTTIQPPHFHNLISFQRFYSTRSSYVVNLARPPTSSCLKARFTVFFFAVVYPYLRLCYDVYLDISISGATAIVYMVWARAHSWLERRWNDASNV